MSQPTATLVHMTKVLVSTTVSQGQAPGDFCWVPDGELVARYGMVCDDERPDGSGCGCGRSFAGLTTHKGTTTAMVIESTMTENQWRAALHQTLVDTGWAEYMPAEDLAGVIDEVAALDLYAAAALPVGAVLGRLAYNDRSGNTSDTLLLRRVTAG